MFQRPPSREMAYLTGGTVACTCRHRRERMYPVHTHSFVEIAVIIGANRMELAADPGQMLMIWTAEPGSKPGQPGLQGAPDHP